MNFMLSYAIIEYLFINKNINDKYIIYINNILKNINHTANKRHTPPKTHFAGFSFVRKLNVQTNVGPRCFVL